MPAPKGEIATCAACSKPFRLPSNLPAGATIRCPSCGHHAGEEADPAPAETAADHLPGPRKQAVDLDLTGIVVRESNPQSTAPPPRQQSQPPPFDPEKLASTSDADLAMTGDEPRQRVMSSRERQRMVGWDEDAATDTDANLPQPAIGARYWILAGSLIAAAGVFALVVRPKKPLDRPEPPPPPPASSVSDPETPGDGDDGRGAMESLYAKLGPQEFDKLAIETIESFLAAPDIETRLDFCRDRERVRPLMEKYYAENPGGAIAHRGIEVKDALEVTLFATVLLEGEGEPRHCVLRRDGESDRLVVDWESFTIYGEMTIRDFLTQKPEQPVLLRLGGRNDDYFNHGLNEPDYSCFRLIDLPTQESFYGYAKRGSDLATKLKIYLEDNPDTMKALTLRVRYPDPPQGPKQCLIEEIVTLGWLIE